jgi:hypothetical protein
VLRAVAVPTEHGGWGLTAEPAVLGLLLAPGAAGACLALAAIVAFVARTPVRIVLTDAHRGRRLQRTEVARRVAAAEGAVLIGLGVAAVALADGPFWWFALPAAPLVALELWFDARSRSRRLVPELAGVIGISSVAAMIVVAGGEPWTVGLGAWLVLAARGLTSVPAVRSQVARLHGRTPDGPPLLVTDVVAVVVAALAVAVDGQLLAGAVTIPVVVVAQRALDRGPVPRAAVLGARQVVIGATVVLVTALGVLAPGSPW